MEQKINYNTFQSITGVGTTWKNTSQDKETSLGIMIFKEIWSIPVNLPTRRRRLERLKRVALRSSGGCYLGDEGGGGGGKGRDERASFLWNTSTDRKGEQWNYLFCAAAWWWLSTQNSSSRIFHERGRVEHLVLVLRAATAIHKSEEHILCPGGGGWWFDINLSKRFAMSVESRLYTYFVLLIPHTRNKDEMNGSTTGFLLL